MHGPALGFFMYPQAESATGRKDSLDPKTFAYTITAIEVDGVDTDNRGAQTRA
jgi:hypothetical protein